MSKLRRRALVQAVRAFCQSSPHQPFVKETILRLVIVLPGWPPLLQGVLGRLPFCTTLIKGDNRPIIDFMNSVGKLRRTDLQKLLTEAQHARAFSLPPILWSYTPREFNKCADFLAGITRDYARQSLTPELLPYSLSPFSFPLPPSLSSLYSPPVPFTLSPPSSAFSFHESPDFPISSFPQLARKAVHSPPLQRYLRALQKGPSSLTSLSVLYRPTADDQRGRLYPLAVGASKLSRHYRALLFGRSHIELDITGSHYQFFQRFSLSLSPGHFSSLCRPT